MTQDQINSLIQGTGSLFAATAAVAAWRATRQVAEGADYQVRLRQDADLKAIHAGIGRMTMAAAKGQLDEVMNAWLDLRSRLAITRPG